MFAVGLNWGGAPSSVFYALTGDTRAILHGEVWRLFTAPLIHAPGDVGHLVAVILGLYFLGPSLEGHWGGARFLRFVALSALGGFVVQMLVELVLPATIATRLVGAHWYGLLPAIDAIAIAWALSFRGQVVRLFMVLPVTSGVLIVVVVGYNLAQLVLGEQQEAGLIAPFGAMLFGWLLGGGTPSPLRKAWLRLRLAQLDTEARRDSARRKRRNPGGLRVIPGGRADDDDDGKGPDGRYLN
jgi:membrane associated rhomboid family serine protease